MVPCNLTLLSGKAAVDMPDGGIRCLTEAALPLVPSCNSVGKAIEPLSALIVSCFHRGRSRSLMVFLSLPAEGGSCGYMGLICNGSPVPVSGSLHGHGVGQGPVDP